MTKKCCSVKIKSELKEFREEFIQTLSNSMTVGDEFPAYTLDCQEAQILLQKLNLIIGD